MKMLQLKLVLIFVWQCFVIVYCDDYCDPLMVRTSDGMVKGIYQRTYLDNKTYIAFKGIPYAQPPVGELRFREPIKIKSWSGVRELTKDYGKSCHSFKLTSPSLASSENCLFINVYTPDKKSAKKSVMFYIHGGGFCSGDGSDGLYGPDLLIEQDVIVVTINYRLGPLGFLNFGEYGYTGNMGFKDQLLALKWNKKNIEHFGGDPNSITLFGQSAGGCSVHLHVLNSESKACFKRAIPMSGNAFNPFTFFNGSNQEIMRQTFKDELEASGKTLLEYLKNAPIDLIVKKTPCTPPYSILSTIDLYWSATMEEPKKAITPFIVRSPRNTYVTTNIKTEMMCGGTTSEFFTFLIPVNFINWIKQLNANFDTGFPVNGLTLTPDSPEYISGQKEIHDYYFGSGEIQSTLESFIHLADMKSHVNFDYPSFKTMMMHAKQAKTICYRNDLNTTLNGLKIWGGLGQLEGTGHTEDIPYIFVSYSYIGDYNKLLLNPNDTQNAKALSALRFTPKFFADFAKTGSSCNFETVNSGSNKCILISNDGLKSIEGPRTPAMDFWSKITEKLQPWIAGGF